MTSVLSPPTAVGWPREEARMHTIKFNHPITVDDLESFPDELRIELHEGNLYIMSPAIAWHTDVSRRIANVLEAAGMVAFQEMGVESSKIDLRVPDVSALRIKPRRGQFRLPPSEFLIAVEVVSKSSQAQDRILKPLHYAEVGIPEYWRVEEDPDADWDALIYQCKLSDEGKYVEADVVKLSELESDSPK
jgi:Uma2 family endonuclease